MVTCQSSIGHGGSLDRTPIEGLERRGRPFPSRTKRRRSRSRRRRMRPHPGSAVGPEARPPTRPEQAAVGATPGAEGRRDRPRRRPNRRGRPCGSQNGLEAAGPPPTVIAQTMCGSRPARGEAAASDRIRPLAQRVVARGQRRLVRVGAVLPSPAAASRASPRSGRSDHERDCRRASRSSATGRTGRRVSRSFVTRPAQRLPATTCGARECRPPTSSMSDAAVSGRLAHADDGRPELARDGLADVSRRDVDAGRYVDRDEQRAVRRARAAGSPSDGQENERNRTADGRHAVNVAPTGPFVQSTSRSRRAGRRTTRT